MERSIQQNAVLSLLDVAGIAAMAGAVRINREYQRVDMARNDAVKTFLKNTKDDGDVLIMLDCDHLYPRDIIPKLAKSCDYLHEVVGALAFRRSLPYDPVFYDLNDEGKATIPTSFTGGMVRCDIVGTGSIAIRRSVFTKLDKAGFPWPYFRFSYRDGFENEVQRTEDWNFGLNCKAAGIAHWVNQDVMIPHLTVKQITHEDWFATLKEAEERPAEAEAKYAKLGMTFTKEGN